MTDGELLPASEVVFEKFDGPQRCSIFCGAESALCRALRSPAPWTHRESIDSYLRHGNSDLLKSLASSREERDVYVETLQALAHSLAAAEHGLSVSSKTQGNKFVESIRSAATAFQCVWGSEDDAVDMRSPVSEYERRADLQLWNRFVKALAKTHVSPIPFWVLWDLLNRWTSHAANSTAAVRSATTPVLAVGAEAHGALYWLTIELIPCAGGGELCPDPLHLGLTDITFGPDAIRPASGTDAQSSTEAEGPAGCRSFLKNTRRIWELTGLGASFRGRWRLQSIPGVEVPREIQREPIYSPRFKGRSAEAAFLAALLTATGCPYRFAGNSGSSNSAQSVEESLEPGVAATACVADPPPGRALLSTRLEPVADDTLANKLRAAGNAGLRRVVVAREQLDERSVKEVKDECLLREAQSRKVEQEYRGLQIEDTSTVAELLDALLVTNRFLRAYQSHARGEWLKQWAIVDGKSTGRAANDLAPWEGDS